MKNVNQSKGDSALSYLQAALQAFQKVNDQEMVGTVYNNLRPRFVQEIAPCLHFEFVTVKLE